MGGNQTSPKCGTDLKHTKMRSGSGALHRSRRTHFKKLPEVLPSPTRGTLQTFQETSGPKNTLEDGYHRLAPRRHATTELRQLSASPFQSQERAGPHVAPSTSASPTARVGRRGSAQRARRCAGWHLAPGFGLFHTFSCLCSNLQGQELQPGSRVGVRRVFLKHQGVCKASKKADPTAGASLSRRGERRSSGATLSRLAPGASGLLPRCPLPAKCADSLRKVGPLLLGAG